MPLAVLKVPPKVPRSVIAPFCQRKPWPTPVKNVMLLSPTTCPRLLMPKASLAAPPGSAPTAVVAPSYQSKAWEASEEVSVAPTTSLEPLMPKASARSNVPPNVPRSVIAPFCQRKAWGRIPEVVVLLSPTTCPTLLTPKAMLAVPPRVPKSVIVRPADRGCPDAGWEDGNTATSPLLLSDAVSTGPKPFHAKTFPAMRLMPESDSVSPT